MPHTLVHVRPGLASNAEVTLSRQAVIETGYEAITHAQQGALSDDVPTQVKIKNNIIGTHHSTIGLTASVTNADGEQSQAILLTRDAPRILATFQRVVRPSLTFCAPRYACHICL